MSQDGIEVKRKAILYKYGITQKFGGAMRAMHAKLLWKMTNYSLKYSL